MNTLTHIFLDFDGPLVDGQRKHYHCYRSILERFGYLPIEYHEYWESKRNLMNRRDLLARSAAGSIYDEFLTAWLEMIESPEALNLDQLQEGAIECLRRWKAEGIHLTLVTMRQNKEALERQLALLELRPLLDSVLRCSHDAGGEGKAALVREKFPGLDYSAQALWVGDTEADWEAAQSLTCPIVLLANGLRNEEALSLLGPVEVVPSIASLINTI